jgi:hypothetical protein
MMEGITIGNQGFLIGVSVEELPSTQSKKLEGYVIEDSNNLKGFIYV